MRIAVVGTGFGGLSAAHAAEKHGAEVVQIGPEKFEYLPSLAKVLSGRKKAEELEVKPDFRWEHINSTVSKVEEHEGGVKLYLDDGSTVEADYVVLAPGARAWVPVEGAYPLYRVDHARRVAEALEKVGKDAKIAIVGTGLVGLEAAGELAWTREAGLSNYEVFMLEAAPVLSPTLPCEKVRKVLPKRLEKHGIKYYLNAMVSEIKDGKVVTKDGKEYEADAVIWAAGVQGPSIEVPCAKLAKRGFIEADEYLRAKGCKRIYVAGDASSTRSLKMAEEALRHGWYAVLHILGKKKEPYKPFLTPENPYCFITLGPNDGISVMKKVVVPGKLAPIVKDFLEKLMIKWAREAKMRPPVPV